jgi:hypothetical protein
MAPTFPLEEIAKHKTADDLWLLIHGKVNTHLWLVIRKLEIGM